MFGLGVLKQELCLEMQNVQCPLDVRRRPDVGALELAGEDGDGKRIPGSSVRAHWLPELARIWVHRQYASSETRRLTL